MIEKYFEVMGVASKEMDAITKRTHDVAAELADFFKDTFNVINGVMTKLRSEGFADMFDGIEQPTSQVQAQAEMERGLHVLIGLAYSECPVMGDNTDTKAFILHQCPLAYHLNIAHITNDENGTPIDGQEFQCAIPKCVLEADVENKESVLIDLIDELLTKNDLGDGITEVPEGWSIQPAQ